MAAARLVNLACRWAHGVSYMDAPIDKAKGPCATSAPLEMPPHNEGARVERLLGDFGRAAIGIGVCLENATAAFCSAERAGVAGKP